MADKIFKIQFKGDPKPLWYYDENSMKASIQMMLGCPIDDGPAEVTITTYEAVKTEKVTLP